jgi:hypothetical protein
MFPLLAATARRQGSQLAAKNSANAALSWLTPVNPSVGANAYLPIDPPSSLLGGEALLAKISRLVKP